LIETEEGDIFADVARDLDFIPRRP
jgi:hypothetical protein